MKRIFVLVFSVLLTISGLYADEGMWLLSLIGKNYQQMKALGFKLTPEDIYSINHSSMKDAVAAMNHGMCTMELISPKGLLLTNHHCAYNALQELSTVENNYLKNGFWATSYEEELPVPGMTAWFLVRMEDVTDQVLSEVTDKMSPAERDSIIYKVSQKLVIEASEGGKYEAEVKEMFDGNQYFLFVYKVYRDIRLVGAPPEAIGKFGGDTDNWMWPRHTGDFSLFRVYTGPDGEPADYSPDNVPLESKYYFKISLKPKKEGDYAQIMGFPGSTSRYLTTWEVKDVMNHENAIRIKVRGLKLSILKKYMDQDPKIRLQYAAKYAQSANYYKYSIGQNRDLKRLKVIKQKKEIQKELVKWINADPARKEKYGEALKMIKYSVKNSSDLNVALNYWFEALYLGPEIVRQGIRLIQVLNYVGDDVDAARNYLKENAKDFFEDYNAKVDKDLFVNLVGLYMKHVKPEYYPDMLKDINQKYGSLEKYAEKIYNNSFLVDKDKYFNAVETYSKEQLLKDPGVKFAESAYNAYKKLSNLLTPLEQQLRTGRRLYMQAYMKMYKEKDPNKLFYPDANSTERLTYGTIKGYHHPALKDFFTTTDSYDPKTQYFKPFTTIDQYLVKEEHYKGTPYEEEFVVPEKLKELIKNKDFGRYADPNLGTIVTCFLTNNDITGGNSGSPVIDGEGNLIGVAFDGNWEAMSGDIEFDEQLQRTIVVDIRFVLFIIDKYANAQRLIDEMTIVQ